MASSLKIIIIFSVCSILVSNYQPVQKTFNGKIFVHIMPWFETKESSGTGNWGIHWTMANQNPDITDSTGRRQIASHFYPEIGPYASGDVITIDHQLLQMKYAGIDGVIIDWPGTVDAYDYKKNLKNSEAIIARTEKVGLLFAICYEDQNIKIAASAGIIKDEIAAAQADMQYLLSTYFNKSNYFFINGQPLLLVFGPQTFTSPDQWANIFSVFSTKPVFFTLWYQGQQAGTNALGEYPWIYTDYIDGVRNFINYRKVGVKFGVAYPGFNTFYQQGGWSGPTWGLPYNNTFSSLLDLCASSNLEFIQLATWNDYGEGTMIEPTREFGTTYLEALGAKLGVKYGKREFQIVRRLYEMRRRFEKSNNITAHAILDRVFDSLNALQIDIAESAIRRL